MNDAPNPTPWREHWAVPVGSAIVLAAITITAGLWIARSPMNRAEPADALGAPAKFLTTMQIPDFELLDQNSAPVEVNIFDGGHTILAFTFTNCPTVCPIMHGHLLRLQSEITGPGVQIVTISVDPKNDTPEALRAYMKRLQIDAATWTMLTGDQEIVSAIASGLMLGYTIDQNDPIELKSGDGSMANIIHSSKLVLIGPDRSVLDLADGLEWDEVQRIGDHAQRAAAGLDR